jgi:site-specific recombinase XerD
MMKKRKNAPRKIPTVLSAIEQGTLMSELRYNGPHRNYLMATLMLNYGLRVSEVRDLQENQVDWDSGYMVITGKGQKDRGLWLSEVDLQQLNNARPSGRGHLFLSAQGVPLSIRYIRYMLLAAGEKAGIKKRVHPHMLRHSFGTDLLRKTKNLVLVQKALGHANIATTTIYTHIVDEELEEALKNLRNGR